MEKHKNDSPSKSNKKENSPMGPDALQHKPVDPEAHGSGSTQQNVNQNHITETGNETKGNTPGGNFNEVRHSRVNKPRNNPNPSQQNAK
ncbi:hypothetical protein [Hymenobacter crusticola]|uniref:Uncharacterized protein n=1 Tax=Hymenobacter crusticola TaxID=1770526 RepID=A0A243W8F9_9BACT|nr:hypothetical protein [Hymenobacter crusticola]OUJ71599.1 hypothetical protein BXP70_21140 [Hymenobacter crusticola]